MRNYKPYPNSRERSSQGYKEVSDLFAGSSPPIQNKGDNMTENKIPNITLALYELDRLMTQVNANREAGDEIVK